MVEELVKVLGSGGSIGGADLSSCLAELPLSVELRAALTDAQRTLVGAIDAEAAAVSGEIAGMASGASSGGDGEVVALLLRLKVSVRSSMAVRYNRTPELSFKVSKFAALQRVHFFTCMFDVSPCMELQVSKSILQSKPSSLFPEYSNTVPEPSSHFVPTGLK